MLLRVATRGVAAFPRRQSSRRYSKIDAYNYCIQSVKTHDFDNYLCGLLVPRSCRSHYFAVRAFNVEMALVKDQANNNAATARVRFQWWREVINGAFSGGDKDFDHPVACAVQSTIRSKKLTRRWVDKIIDSREADLTSGQPETLSVLETYAEASNSSVLYLILEILDIADEKAEYAASHVGVCTGLVASLRGIPYFSSQKQIYLPKDIANKNHLASSVVFKGPQNDSERVSLAGAVFEVASQAHGHLDEARKLLPSTHTKAVYALLPAVRSSMYLEKLQVSEFNPLSSELAAESATSVWFQLRLLNFIWRRKI